PDIRRMRVAKISICRLVPIFWLSVLPVRRDDSATLLYRVEGESKMVGNGEEPDVLGGVLPVAFRAAALLTFPCDAILQLEVSRPDALDRGTRSPIAADVNRGCWLYQRGAHS